MLLIIWKNFCTVIYSPQAKKLYWNQIKASLFTVKYPLNKGLQKYLNISRKKHISPMLWCVSVGKFPHSLKDLVKDICAIFPHVAGLQGDYL